MRVEFGNGQLVVAEIFPGDGLHLLGTHRLQLFDHAFIQLVRDPDGFHLADFHGLGKHRIKFVDLTGNQLCLGARQFVVGHAVLLDAGELGAEAGFQLGPRFPFTRRTLQVEHAGTA